MTLMVRLKMLDQDESHSRPCRQSFQQFGARFQPARRRANAHHGKPSPLFLCRSFRIGGQAPNLARIY